MAGVCSYPLSINTLGEEEIEAATEVLRSGKTTMGERVEEFEEAFAKYVHAPYAVMVNSGSSADLLCALTTDSDGEVILPAVTWPTHVWSWEQSPSVVRFCDVNGINTNAGLIEEQMTTKTRVLSIVHLMGAPVDMSDVLELVNRHGLVLHEDCCEALGAKYRGYPGKPVGSSADVAAWSFFFSHQLSTMEGGMVTTMHSSTDRHLRSLRSHGWNRHYSSDKYTFTTPGFNLRPTEVSAAIGLVQLRKLDAMNEVRAQNFDEFERILQGHENIKLAEPSPMTTPSWFGVPMFVREGRDQLAKYLESSGVETRPILAGNLRTQPGFKGFHFPKTPGADLVEQEGLFVGLHPVAYQPPYMTASEVASLIRNWS